MNRLWNRIVSLKSQERQEAEDKFQVALLFATMNQICKTLNDFMTSTQNELRTMNERQLKLLNMQNQYKNEIKTEVDKIVRTTYCNIEDEQRKLFCKMLGIVKSETDKMVKSIDKSSSHCKAAVDKSGNYIERILQAEGFFGLLWALSPLFVLGDLVIRLVQYFS